MKSKTYDEWQTLGYCVVKGEKATGHNTEGKAIFTNKQVTFVDVVRKSSWGPDVTHWDEWPDYGDAEFFNR